jgi:selT/selW/selH-like putative selenoprotein
LTDKLLNRFKQDIESLSLAPYADGRFEVVVDDTTIYSKLKTGQFPDEGAILDEVAKRL